MAESHHHSPLPEPLTPDQASRLAGVFSLLADPSRLRLVYVLIDGGAMCVSDIATAVGSTDSATSHQLAKLRSAGMVRSERHGREIWYQLEDTHVRLLLDVAAQHYLVEGHA